MTRTRELIEEILEIRQRRRSAHTTSELFFRMIALERAFGRRSEIEPELLKYFPVALGTWAQQTGTWDDAKRNDKIQLEVKALAKFGTDIRDRGGYIDALCSELDGFVTSDKELVGAGPSKRINERFFTKVLTPEQLAEELGV